MLSVSSQASRFASEIVLSYTEADHEHRVDVKSLLGMALLPLRNGSMVRLQTRGRDELEALGVHVACAGKAGVMMDQTPNRMDYKFLSFRQILLVLRAKKEYNKI